MALAWIWNHKNMGLMGLFSILHNCFFLELMKSTEEAFFEDGDYVGGSAEMGLI